MLERGLDQAAGLRRMMAVAAPGLLAFPLGDRGPHGWIAQLARGLCGLGRRPLVLDAARGAVAPGLGARPRRELIDVLDGSCAFEQAVHATAEGVHVLRADRGVEAFVASGAPAVQLFGGLGSEFDDLLLAMPAAEIASLAQPQDTVPVLGLQPGPQGLLDCYATAKQLAQGFGWRRFACVARGAADEAAARRDAAQLAAAVARFLGAHVEFAGWLPAARAEGALQRAAHGLLQAVASPPAARMH